MAPSRSSPRPPPPRWPWRDAPTWGKSSLLNKLFGRKGLVKVSATPGKTANINFFEVDGIRFVDLPGYGFAKVSQKEKQRWADLISGYFAQERSFNLVIALVDIRHDAQRLDHEMVAFPPRERAPLRGRAHQGGQARALQADAAGGRHRTPARYRPRTGGDHVFGDGSGHRRTAPPHLRGVSVKTGRVHSCCSLGQALTSAFGRPVPFERLV